MIRQDFILSGEIFSDDEWNDCKLGFSCRKFIKNMQIDIVALKNKRFFSSYLVE
jgi:hypothetical protein